MMIRISYITYIYLIFSFFGGYYDQYLLSLIILFIHEMGHYLMAKYLCFDIEHIKILPFGMFVSIKDFYEQTIFKEICVVLAGPATHIFMYMFFEYLYQGVYKEYLLMINACVFYFNLMPIYPMDGSKIINLFLQNFIDLKQSMFFTLKISVLSLIILSLYYLSLNTVMIIIYLYVQQIYFYKDIYMFLRLYYLKDHYAYKNKMIIHYNNEYRRGYLNYYYVNNEMIDESKNRNNLIKSIKKV